MVSLAEAAVALAKRSRQQAVDDLVEELRIPSVSTLPEHAEDVQRNAEWLRQQFGNLGFAVSVSDVEGGTHAILQADSAEVPGAPTLTIYGHYDVQPAEPLDLWEHPPFEPYIENGIVYARGCSDNKGNHLAALKAAEYLLAAGGLPINLRFLLEGEEEMSGPALPTYIEGNALRLASNYSLIWDGAFASNDRPLLITGLRGMLYVELEAVGPAHDLHSGLFGGVVPNPLNTLSRVIGELKGRDGRVTIPGFYDDIREIDFGEQSRLFRDPGLEQWLTRATGSAALEGEAGYDLTERIGYRPTLDVNGIIGGFTGEGVKTIIPSVTRAKISMRLVPDQDPDRVFAALCDHVATLGTAGVRVSVRKLSAASPVLLSADSPASRATSAAFETAFGRPPVFAREGMSIPVTSAFQRFIGGDIVCSGLVQPDARAHSPNERLSLDHFHRGTEMLIHLMTTLGSGGQAGQPG
ncbi:MAG: M20/M25/M40 family metallo-hydrolase [Candidatus Dormibacteria bacterium]